MTEDRAISLNAVKEMIDWFPHWSITKNAFAHGICVDDLMKGLDDLPSVTPTDEEMAMQYQRGYIDGFKEGKATFEPKTGQWIHTDDCDEEWQYRCSNCDMPSKSNSHRYCSKCGADMYPLFKQMQGIYEPQERSEE